MAYEYSSDGFRIRWLPIVIGLIAAGGLLVKGCQTGPFGRSQIVALNPQQEAALGAQSYQQFLQQAEVVHSGPVVDAVRAVAERLAKATANPDFLHAAQMKSAPKFDWEVRLVRSKQINAFCLPGGKIVVYTGIVPVCRTDAGLATVMGHEIGHALAHHGAERMAQQQVAQILQASAALSMDNLSYEQRQTVMAALGAGTQFGVLLPFSRKHESEADHIGLLLMATAGYDPRASVTFWQRMSKATGGGQRSEFSSTHPSHEHRIRDLDGWLDQAMPLYQKSTHQPDRLLPGLRE